MKEIIYPEATLIDIKRISKECQKKWQSKINYSRLFDLKEEYKFTNTYCEFSASDCIGERSKTVIVGTLTSTMNPKKHFYKIDIHMRSNKYNDYREYTEFNNPEMAIAIRPVFKYSEIKEHCQIIEELAPGYLLVTFGNYPNKKNNAIKTKYLFLCPRIKIYHTGNKYTLLEIKDKEIIEKEYPEIIIDGTEKRVVIKDEGYCENIYEVEPVYFLVDVKKDFAISRDIMFCLPTFVSAKEVSSYKETLPYEFLNTYFVPELMQSVTRQNEIVEIEAEENPVIKDLIDSILALINNTCLEIVVKEELQSLIEEYNNDLDKEKEKKPTIELSLETKTTPEERFIENLQSLYSKITNFPYYLESRIIYSCLNLDKDLETNNELYKDIKNIFTYILPTLPSELRISYQDSIIEILKFAEKLIINLYKTPTNEKINIELIIREKLQPLLASIYKDVTTNFININLNEIIGGIFASSTDLYLTNLFELINDIVREIEILTENNKSEEYRSKLKELLNIESKTKTSSDLMKLYIDLIKLKAKLEEKETKKENLERRKIRRKLI